MTKRGKGGRRGRRRSSKRTERAPSSEKGKERTYKENGAIGSYYLTRDGGGVKDVGQGPTAKLLLSERVCQGGGFPTEKASKKKRPVEVRGIIQKACSYMPDTEPHRRAAGKRRRKEKDRGDSLSARTQTGQGKLRRGWSASLYRWCQRENEREKS